MPFFSKVFRSKDGASSSKHKGHAGQTGLNGAGAPKPTWADAWTRKEVGAEEVEELLNVCTQELKSRALDTPFLLLPFRPGADTSSAKTFIRNFFKAASSDSTQYRGKSLKHEMKLVEPMVLCSIMKWCWSRLKGGVVTWNVYELFKVGEQESRMSKHAFDDFVPLSVESDAHKMIIFDFFDLLAAIAANGKQNGLGGRKLSRLAGWWAFEHSDAGAGFDGGYKSWANAADATSHLFFAYLRSRAPDGTVGTGGISQLSRSLQALVSQTEYPPETPTLLQIPASKVVMIVESVSPTPFALLRRAKHFEYRDNDPALQRFSEYDDPLRALTPECRRVLDCISSTNQTTMTMLDVPTSSPVDSSWTRFEDMGFSSVLDGSASNGKTTKSMFPRASASDTMRPSAATKTNDLGRPSTPSWADFMSAGFSDDPQGRGPPSLLLPPDQILPPISPARGQSSHSHLPNDMKDAMLTPGELAGVTKTDLDETFWWVWMTSLAGEEPPERKAVFGRCAFVETEISSGRWLVVEEQVKGAARIPDESAVFVEKKSRFGLSMRGRARGPSSNKKQPPFLNSGLSRTTDPAKTLSRTTVGSVQEARVHAAAAALVQKQKDSEQIEREGQRRGRSEEESDSKTTSVLTMQPVILKEAGPAMQWARKFDKETIRAKYLGDPIAGRGSSVLGDGSSPSGSATNLGSYLGHVPAPIEKDTMMASEPLVSEHAAIVPSMAGTRTILPGPGPTANFEPLVPTSPTSPTTKTTRRGDSQSSITPDALQHTERKPIALADPNAARQHPALRQSSPPQPSAAATAALAASRAMQNKTLRPDKSESAVAKSKAGSTRGGFKKLFQKFENNDKDASSGPLRKANGTATLRSPDSPTLNRKASLMRKKPVGGAQAEQLTTVPYESTATSNAPPKMQEADEGEPGPEVPSKIEERPSSDAVMNGLVPEEPTARFSNFSQGPLEDPPEIVAALHNGQHVEPLASEHTHSTNRAAALLYTGTERETTIPSTITQAHSETERDMADDELSTAEEVSAPVDLQSSSADRWAQVRKNAAERRTSEEAKTTYSRQSHSQSIRTDRTDEGETSGEETIESRVARIKARVAELTSNVPNNAQLTQGTRI